jgi:glycosyltransferase involved in cell wall biosynthesis
VFSTATAADRTTADADRTAGATDRTGDSGDQSEERASLEALLAASAVAVVTDPRARPGFALRAARAGVALVVPQGGVVAALLGGEAQTVVGTGEGVATVPSGDVDALEEAVRALLDNPAARADLVATARARVADWPDVPAVAAQLAALYERASRPTAEDSAAVSDTPGRSQ